MTRFYHPDFNQSLLSDEEAFHATRVLRLNKGDAIILLDGKGKTGYASISSSEKDKVKVEIREVSESQPPSWKLQLAIAPTKNMDRMEWLVEKLVEIGISDIHLIMCRHSERKEINIGKLQKVALSALKQSGNPWLPTMHAITPFPKFIVSCKTQQRLLAYVETAKTDHIKHRYKPGTNVCILIGPEGDFSPDEVEMAINQGWEQVSLGPTRLRTETAGLYAAMACHMNNQ